MFGAIRSVRADVAQIFRRRWPVDPADPPLLYALRRSMMVASASFAGCCRTKLGDGWSVPVTDLPTQRRV